MTLTRIRTSRTYSLRLLSSSRTTHKLPMVSRRWAPCPELSQLINPFISSLELRKVTTHELIRKLFPLFKKMT